MDDYAAYGCRFVVGIIEGTVATALQHPMGCLVPFILCGILSVAAFIATGGG